MNNAQKQPPKKVFDVMRPGKALASATSRPVIVGHKPMVQDGLIGGDAAKGAAQPKRPFLSALAKVTLQPPEHHEAAEPAPPPAALQGKPEPAPPVPQESTPVAASVNLPAEPETSKPNPLPGRLLADAVKEPDNPNPMTQHGDVVVVSHHQGKFTFGQALLAILAIVVLTAVAVNFLLDAQVIKTDLGIPHTNWF